MTLQSGIPEEVGMSPQRVRHFTNLAKGWVDEGLSPAIVILVARRGIIVAHEAFGCLSPEPDSPPLQRHTLFPLASTTKPITATSVMILVEEGRLALNRPVQDYIPEFVGEGKENVMVHHLLTHTPGIRNQDLDDHIENKKEQGVVISPPEPNQDPKIHELLVLGYDTPLWKPPGKEMSYFNYGYVLLGEMVRRLSGKNLPVFAQERIFEPLGMEGSHYGVPESLWHRVVKGPEDAPAAWFYSQDGYRYPSAPGGAYSTAIDMAVFGHMFLNGGHYGGQRVLSPATVTAMTRNQIPGIGAGWKGTWYPEASWGFGWDVLGPKKDSYYGGALQSPETFGHGGWGGVRLWVDPVYGMVMVYLSVSLEPAYPQHYGLSQLFVDAATAAVVEI